MAQNYFQFTFEYVSVDLNVTHQRNSPAIDDHEVAKNVCVIALEELGQRVRRDVLQVRVFDPVGDDRQAVGA